MGGVRHSGPISLMWALRGLNFSPLLVSARWARWARLGVAGQGGLTAAYTLIGAGAVGVALLALRYTPSSLLPSKFTLSMLPTSEISETGREMHRTEEWTVPGLHNAGNNCYLNVILQALASSKTFVSFMTTCAEVTLRAEKTTLVSCSKDLGSMPLAVSVSSLMKELSQLGDVHCTSSPQLVMRALKSYVKHFDMASQQDAAEALVHLACAIQEEQDNHLESLKPTFQSFATASFIHDRSRERCDQLLECWKQLLHWPLEGTLASSLTCQSCAHQNTTEIQFFNDISLSPLQDCEGNILQGCTLENCLEKFTGPERVDSVKCSNCSHEAAVNYIDSICQDSRSSDGFQCKDYSKMLRSKLKMIEECGCDDYCQCEGFTMRQGGIWKDVHANALKQLKIGRSPEVVCFQLQRMMMSNDGSLKKLMGHVSFPKVLDLFPFTFAAESGPELGYSMLSKTMESEVLDQQHILVASSEEDFHVTGQRTSIKSQLPRNGEKKLGDQETTIVSDTIYVSNMVPGPSEVCPADLSGSPEIQMWDRATVLAIDAEPSSDLKKHEQICNLKDILHQNISSASPLLSASSGHVLTYSSWGAPMPSLYVPKVVPRQLSQLPLLTSHVEHGQQFPTTTRGRLGNIPGLDIAEDSTIRSISRSSKYSRRLLYDLVSVVVHQGGPQSGHYIVYRKMNLPNENLVFEDLPSFGLSVGNHRPDTSGGMGNGRACFDGALPMQFGFDLDEIEANLGHSPELTSLSDEACIGRSSVLIEQLEGLGAQEIRGYKMRKDNTRMISAQSVQEKVCDRLGDLKLSINNIGSRDRLIALWFRVSDTHVERVSEQEVFSARAALLFYEQM